MLDVGEMITDDPHEAEQHTKLTQDALMLMGREAWGKPSFDPNAFCHSACASTSEAYQQHTFSRSEIIPRAGNLLPSVRAEKHRATNGSGPGPCHAWPGFAQLSRQVLDRSPLGKFAHIM